MWLSIYASNSWQSVILQNPKSTTSLGVVWIFETIFHSLKYLFQVYLSYYAIIKQLLQRRQYPNSSSVSRLVFRANPYFWLQSFGPLWSRHWLLMSYRKRLGGLNSKVEFFTFWCGKISGWKDLKMLLDPFLFISFESSHRFLLWTLIIFAEISPDRSLCLRNAFVFEWLGFSALALSHSSLLHRLQKFFKFCLKPVTALIIVVPIVLQLPALF